MNKKLLEAKELAETEPDQAIRLCNEVLNEDFNNSLALFIQGFILMEAEKFGLAYNMFKRCAELDPKHTEIYNNMGMCYQYSNQEEAMRLFRKALELEPNNYRAMANLGMLYMETGEPKKAIKLCTDAIKINPESVAAHSNRGCAYLMDRQWEKGWKDFHWGLGGKWRKKIDYGVPDWNGEKGTVLVYGEQGLGDEILFLSCLPDLQKTNDVVIDCTARLRGLFERSFNCPTFGERYSKEPLIVPDGYKPDYKLSMGTLPMFFRNKHRDFPGDAYLKADPERCLQWRALLGTLPGKKVGLAWTGGLKNTNSAGRSFDLSMFEPLFGEHTFISLEYNEPDQALLDKYGIIHWGRAVNKGVDYDETMALINELDLVISVTTTVVHGAGALGVPCWCLVPKHPSYRFHLSGDMPWHNSVKLFRQKDDWESVIEEVKQKLTKEFPNE